jgi:hypothetical protein
MPPESESIFVRLRAILQKHAGRFSVTKNTVDRYCLEGSPGPATLRARRGNMKRQLIPVAWVEARKSYVSYHLMGVYGNAKLLEGMSKALQARMSGRACFDFKTNDEALFKELEQMTALGLTALIKAGFVSEQESANT